MTDRGELDYLVRDTRLRHFGRSANEVRAGSHPHLLRWIPDPVHPHWPTLTSTSSQSYRDSNQMRRSEWPLTASLSGNLRFPSSRVSGRMWLPKDVTAGRSLCVLCSLEEDFHSGRPWPMAGQRRADFMPQEHAAYLAKPDYKATKKGPHSQHRAAPR